jgi:hypothetical protein
MEMDQRKVWSILDFIRGQGRLPTDQFGQILPVDDLMSWFGLDERLSPAESRRVRLELAVMAETQQTLDELKMAERLRSASQS